MCPNLSISTSTKRRIPIVAALWALAGAASNAMASATETVFQVNSHRVPCVGVAPMNCLQVRRGDDATEMWQNFYSQIQGFDYEPGYLYRLVVRETKLPPDQVPADASSIRYELVTILDKSVDPRFSVHDIWVVRRVAGMPVEDILTPVGGEQPYIEFNIVRRAYLGNDGCGDFSGEILAVDDGAMRLGPAGRPNAVQPCAEDTLGAGLTTALERAALWRREQLWLTLHDNAGAEVVALRKVD